MISADEARLTVQASNIGAYLAVCFGPKPEADMYAIFDAFEHKFITPWLSRPDVAWLAAARRL